MTKVNNGIDGIARSLGAYQGASYFTGTSTTAPTATTFTMDGASGVTASSGGPPAIGGLVGYIVVRAGVTGTVLSNTTTVLTIDYWHDPTNPGGAAATTPAAGQWVLVSASGGFTWAALSSATRAIAAADAFMTNDGTTISEQWSAAGNIKRKLATYGHTNGTATYTETVTWTTNASDPATFAANRVGWFQHGVTAATTTTTTGIMLAEQDIPSPPTLLNNGTDSITVTFTGTIS